MKLNLSRGGLIAALAVLFFALMILNNELLRGVRIDLTENKLYTLSEGTLNILEQIQEPINLYLFFSEKETESLPQIRSYYDRVKEVLEEYRLLAGGKLKVHYVNPEAFSQEEDRATQLGLQAASAGGTEKIYFGLAGTNALDTTEVIPFLQPGRENFLEYDLGKLIYNLIHVKKPVLGLMTDLPMYPTRINPATGRMNEPWVITQELEQLFDVELVFTDAEEIAGEIDVLMVVHPKDLPDKTMYAIDQFIMRGGKGLFFVDPMAEADVPPPVADEPARDIKSRSSGLNRLFSAWGFSVDEDTMIADPARALQVSFQGQEGGGTISHPSALGMRARDFNREDVVMNALETIHLYLVSHVKVEKEAEVEMTPLIHTTKRAIPVPLPRFHFIADPRTLLEGFKAEGVEYPIAARIQANFKSAFDAPPEDEPEKDEEDGDEGEEKDGEDQGEEEQAEQDAAAQDAAQDAAQNDDKEHLAETAQPGVVTVVADVDVLSDRMWVQKQRILGQSFSIPFANNRDFVINLVDNLFGSKDLIGIRSRASYSRPFTRVEELEEEASRKYRATEKSLQKELQETEAKLQKLQEQRTDKKSALLTASQRAEVRKFQEKKVEIRKKLRNVQHQLNKDIENLGATLKAVNVVAVPAVVIAVALLAGFVRVRRRKRSATA